MLNSYSYVCKYIIFIHKLVIIYKFKTHSIIGNICVYICKKPNSNKQNKCSRKTMLLSILKH